MKEKFKVIGLRFIRAFVSGALASGGAIVGVIYANTSTFVAFKDATGILAISCLIGGISAILQSGDKLLRWQE